MTREEIKALLEHAENYWPMSEKALEYFCMLQLHDLGWECVDAEHDSEQSSSFGRKDFEQVVLTKYLKPRLESLNPDSPKTAIEKAIELIKTQDKLINRQEDTINRLLELVDKQTNVLDNMLVTLNSMAVVVADIDSKTESIERIEGLVDELDNRL